MAETRLIDADKLKKAIKKSAITLPKYGRAIFLNNINDLIDNAPTIQQTIITEFKGCDNCELERPKGEWIVTAEDNDGIHRILCSFCGYEKGTDFLDYITVTFEKLPPFCENCGADMRKGGAE